jgi:hypothetical protein
MPASRKDEPSSTPSGAAKDARAEPRLPLGGGAFASPLAWAPNTERRSSERYWITAIALGSVALFSAGIVVVAWLVHDQRAGAASRARVELRAEPPSEARISSGSSRIAKRVITARAPIAKEPAAVTGSATVQPTVQALPVASAKREPAHRGARADRTARASPPAPALPSELSREQVMAAMLKITPAVNECFGRTHGKVTATFSVVGKTGRVVGARVTGHAGKVGSCIARVVRRARFPKFAGHRLKVTYPFAH